MCRGSRALETESCCKTVITLAWRSRARGASAATAMQAGGSARTGSAEGKLPLSAAEPHHSTMTHNQSMSESLRGTSLLLSSPPEECQQTNAAAVPNILHRVWLGACPGLKETVSLLAASLLLAPDEIVYHILANAPAECLVNRPAPLPPLNLSACWEGLNISFNRIDVSDSKAPLIRAMGDSHKQLLSRQGSSQQVARVTLVDLVRVWALHTRGGL